MLTDTALRNFKPKSKIYKAFDRDGMYVTVSPVGTVTFRYDYRLNGRRETGARQGSCRLCHAANGCISSVRCAMSSSESRSGLRVTAPMGVQLRVSPDQRAGLRSRACA